MYYSVELFTEPREEILSRLTLPENEPEMSVYDSAFLCGLLKQFRPKKIMEIGIAGGATSAIILQCMHDIDAESVLYSVDLSRKFYRGTGEESGYLGEIASKLIPNANFQRLLGKIAPEQMHIIGYDVDFVILDTTHASPGEILDFLAILKWLKKDAIIVLHDLCNNFCANGTKVRFNEMADATKLLFNAVTADKFFNFDDSMPGRGEYPNIGAFRLTSETFEHLEDCFNILASTWYYMPEKSQLESYREAIFSNDMYDATCRKLFDAAVRINTLITSAKPEPANGFERIKNAVKVIIRGYC